MSFGTPFNPAHAARRCFGSAMCLLGLVLAPALATAGDSKLSEAQRTDIIRSFLAERPWAHQALPRNKEGIRIEEDGKIVPSQAETNQLIARLGPAAKAGDRVSITAVRFVHHGIQFDINGGPTRKKKWSDRVSIGVGGANPSGPDPNAQQQSSESLYTETTGSTVLLELKNESAITSDKIKDLLAPVLDFKAMSQAEAYQKSLPPALATAVKNHHALVGMDKEMVFFALGRPPRRIRETKEGNDYEEWIYGAPPKDVEFVRFLGEKVVLIEDMKVTGEKQVRTENEMGDFGGTLDASDQKRARPDGMAAPADQDNKRAPTLLRPGEKSIEQNDAARDPAPAPAPDVNGAPPTSNGPASNAPD
jgi:hypothetical protein